MKQSEYLDHKLTGDFPGRRTHGKNRTPKLIRKTRADVTVRDAKESDAAGLARVSIESWRATYRGILPDESLDKMNLIDRRRMWIGLIKRPGALIHLVALTKNEQQRERIVGFISLGPTRNHRLSYPWEIYSFYISPSYIRRGIGQKLLLAAFQALLLRSAHSCCLWVLTDNHTARHFYKAVGGQVVAKGNGPLEGLTVNGEVYAWEDLQTTIVALETAQAVEQSSSAP